MKTLKKIDEISLAMFILGILSWIVLFGVYGTTFCPWHFAVPCAALFLPRIIWVFFSSFQVISDDFVKGIIRQFIIYFLFVFLLFWIFRVENPYVFVIMLGTCLTFIFWGFYYSKRHPEEMKIVASKSLYI